VPPRDPPRFNVLKIYSARLVRSRQTAPAMALELFQVQYIAHALQLSRESTLAWDHGWTRDVCVPNRGAENGESGGSGPVADKFSSSVTRLGPSAIFPRGCSVPATRADLERAKKKKRVGTQSSIAKCRFRHASRSHGETRTSEIAAGVSRRAALASWPMTGARWMAGLPRTIGGGGQSSTLRSARNFR
jgi:hypothetical protein